MDRAVPGQASKTPFRSVTSPTECMCPSWLSPQMSRLYDRHLGTGWQRAQRRTRRPGKDIEEVDDGELWETHLSLKSRLLEFVRRRAVEQADARGESKRACTKLGRMLSPDALTIGFARRFATYKRADLLLADIERLASHGERSEAVRYSSFLQAKRTLAMSPASECCSRSPASCAKPIRRRFVFIEDYDINVGRHFVQGVDVWLNNPRRPLEASGTSGQKVVLNGGLNLSVLDGWWAEAYDGLNGFSIGTGRTHSNMDVHDRRDGEDLYRALREEVIPLYYQRDQRRTPAWVDQPDEAYDPNSRLALQRRSHGDGLHTEVLRAGRWRNIERYDSFIVM